MLSDQDFLKAIAERQRKREVLECDENGGQAAILRAYLLNGETLDDLLIAKLQSDKVLGGVLMDINNSIGAQKKNENDQIDQGQDREG